MELRKFLYSLLFVTIFFNISICDSHEINDEDNRKMHPNSIDGDQMKIKSRANQLEEEISYWTTNAQQSLSEKIQIEETLNENQAKNIIMFLGDGMSLATVAATRMYMGGEELSLSFEKFPHFGLSKTYCVNRQVADSACTATAYLHGVKGNYGTIGVNAQAPRYDCESELDPTKRTESITKWAQDNCKATGFVTTSRVTHASPAGVYAHTANRDWENDQQLKNHLCDPDKTIDIARQLIEFDVAKKLKVIMGGGRREFRDKTMIDEEGAAGYRGDGRDLIQEWLNERNSHGNASFIWNKQQMLNDIDYENTDFLMGLFEDNHCDFNIDIERQNKQELEPTLSEMTEAAIKLLQNEKQGYFLFVESARIDMAHHETWAHKALDETKEFSKTIELARRMTNESDTLIVVTSDHAHTMTYNGYSLRGNDVLGLSGQVSSDGLPYTTLSYANGLGYYNTFNKAGERLDISAMNLNDPEFEYMATVPVSSETHAGEDVGVYASGPWAHLFIGNYEQSSIPLAMAYAAKIGPYNENPDATTCTGSITIPVSIVVMIFTLIIKLILF